jgi:hypothetical protein
MLQVSVGYFGLISADLRVAAICAIMVMRDRHERPIPDLRPTVKMLQPQTALPTFAAGAKL